MLAQTAPANGGRVKPQALSCNNVWESTSSVVARTPGNPVDNITSKSSVTWEFDREEGGSLIYTPSKGSFTLEYNFSSTGCIFSLSPSSFNIIKNRDAGSRLIIGLDPRDPLTYGIAGRQFVDFVSTKSCPGEADVVSVVNNYMVDFAGGSGAITDQAHLFGTSDDTHLKLTWDFIRP